MLETAMKAADDALATDIVALDVRELTPFADNFLIITVDNPRHMRATINAITKALKDETGRFPEATEGDGDSDWALIDFDGLMIHLFLPEARTFYALEKLWGDAPRIEFTPSQFGSAGTSQV